MVATTLRRSVLLARSTSFQPWGLGDGGDDERFAGGAVPDRDHRAVGQTCDAGQHQRLRKTEVPAERRTLDQVGEVRGSDRRRDGGLLRRGQTRAAVIRSDDGEERFHGLKRRATVTVPVMRGAVRLGGGGGCGVRRRYLTS